MNIINVGGLQLKNPIMNSAGPLAYFSARNFDLNALGAIVLTSTTWEPRPGGVAPVLRKTASGLMNCFAMKNDGFKALLEKHIPALYDVKIPIISSIAGNAENLAIMAAQLSGIPKIAALEVNLVLTYEMFKEMGAEEYYHQCYERLKVVVLNFPRPVWAKLTPMAGELGIVAKKAEDAGCRALVVCNAYWAMTLNPKTGASRLGVQQGFLSGPAIKPISLFHVWRLAQETPLDIIGVGGISNADDVREYLHAGAKAVQVGSASFADHALMHNIVLDYGKGA